MLGLVLVFSVCVNVYVRVKVRVALPLLRSRCTSIGKSTIYINRHRDIDIDKVSVRWPS